MNYLKSVILAGVVLAFSSFVGAQVPVQTTPAKVGIINTNAFANPNGGITRLVNALRTLETEFKPRRDEITTLVGRLNSLQQVPPNTPPAQLVTRRDQAITLQTDIQRKQEDARVAYAKRLSALTDPIRASVFSALEAYGKQRGIDVWIDLSKFPEGVLVVNPGTDQTAAFVRDFNSKNP